MDRTLEELAGGLRELAELRELDHGWPHESTAEKAESLNEALRLWLYTNDAPAAPRDIVDRAASLCGTLGLADGKEHARRHWFSPDDTNPEGVYFESVRGIACDDSTVDRHTFFASADALRRLADRLTGITGEAPQDDPTASFHSCDAALPRQKKSRTGDILHSELRGMAGLGSTQFTTYRKKAGVDGPGRGQRDFRYSMRDAAAILETIVAESSDLKVIQKCKAGLETLVETAT